MSTVSVLILTTLVVVNLNLILTLGILRRLGVSPGAGVTARPDSAVEPALPAVGSEPEEFTALTLEGERLAATSLTGTTLVGFFATDCASCKELIPRFMDYAQAMPGGREQVLVVIAGDPVVAAKLGVLLSTVARLIVEPGEGPVANAFRVRFFPTVCLLDGRRVTASAFDIDRLDRRQRANTARQ
jgi:thiol-disulfide isomerase/thioredoxin